MLNEKPFDKELIKELSKIVKNDIKIYPERCETVLCQHQAIQSDRKYEPVVEHDIDFYGGGIATRYYEDKNFARAYSLTPYNAGIAIFADKREKNYERYSIFVLGEDDGSWFISNTYSLSWIDYSKMTFISLLSEALSVFNANYKDKD